MILGLEEHENPEMAPEALRLQKRQRVNAKQPETSLYGKAPSWPDVFRHVGYYTNRVGGTELSADHMVTKWVQMLVPEMDIRLMVACRGTNRHRIHGQAFGGEIYPWRKTVLVDRNTGAVRDTGPAEEWVKLPKLQQIRSTGPAKLSLTIFGYKPVDASSARPNVQSSDRPSDGSQLVHEMSPAAEIPDSPMREHVPESLPAPSKEENPEYEQGWAPKVIPKSGPRFLALEGSVRSDLRRLHNNLGHPDPERFGKFLKERGASEEVIAGSLDMQCDGCVEMQNQTKLSQPGKIHDNLDFNDVVGGDGAYWASSNGKVYHFMHFIDEATLYHVGVPSGRHFDEQVGAFESAWSQWAGPCKLLYLDPPGEYATDAWAAYLQSEGIKVSMIAAEAHWQNGRCEVHGI
eukprot:s45_g12.t1